MFAWASGSRNNIIFRAPSNLCLSPEEIPAGCDEVWYADCCPKDLNDPTSGIPFRVFDHHVSNQMLHGADPRCHFDMKRSGTSLMAHLLELPDEGGRIARAIEAYDLGRFDDADGQFLADLAASFTQEDMLRALYRDGANIFYETVFAARAEAIAASRRIYAESAAKSALYVSDFRPPGWGQASGTCDAGIAVAPVQWKNDVAEAILNRGYELAVIIDVAGGMVSLRSRNLDCSAMATAMGGGGHVRAAGFKVSSYAMLKSLGIEVFG